MDSELGDLAISYYTLYAEHQRENEEEYLSAKQAYWEDDVWTAAEEENVQKALQESSALCQITDSATIKENPDAWNEFYEHHQNKFFKDRHYLAEAFPDIFGANPPIRLPTTNPTLIEFGCGVGNTLLPLLTDDRWSKIIGVDLSSVAIDLLRADDRFQQAAGRAEARVADLTQSAQMAHLSCTVACLFFCLSALHPDREQPQAVHNVIRTVQPGGWILFRDYGRWDQAQLALGQQRHKQIAEHYYQKQDGTKVYYFSTDDVCRRMLGGGSGMETVHCQYIRRVYRNRRTGETRRRVWVQGMFRKTHC